jgi:hypothetical protein
LISGAAGGQRRVDDLGIVVHGEEYNRCARSGEAESVRNFEARHLRHRDVQHDYVGLQCRRSGEGGSAIVHLPDNDAGGRELGDLFRESDRSV